MITEKDIIADMHVHTIFSKHAYSTVKENIECAKKKNLKFIAITDHFYNYNDFIEKENEFCRIKYLEQRVNFSEENIKVFNSAEFNIGQTIDNYNRLKELKWKPIGLHNWFIDTKNLTTDDLYKLFVESHEKGHNAFVHIERELYKLNKGKYTSKEIFNLLKSIVDYAYDNDIWLEVNESSIIINNKNGAFDRLRDWLAYAKEKGNKIYLGSDAHYCEEVGTFNNALKLLNELNYPIELILNCNENQLNLLLE